MQYVIWGGAALPQSAGVEPLTTGDMLVLEGPWPLGKTALGFLLDDAALAALLAPASGAGGFAVEGLEAPAAGGAFVIAAHKMLDAAGFRPYAEVIPNMLRRFGAHSLARGGRVTRLGGDFVPDRGVVIEFASVDAVVEFYTSSIYAPLRDLRLRTTDPRFVVLSRNGVIPKEAREKAETFLRGRITAR